MHKNKFYRLNIDHWYIDRIIYLIGGVFVFSSALTALIFDIRWLYFTLFIGLMLINFALTGYCPLAIILAKFGAPKD